MVFSQVYFMRSPNWMTSRQEFTWGGSGNGQNGWWRRDDMGEMAN